MKKNAVLMVSIFMILISNLLNAQQVDLATIGKGKPFKLSGGMQVNGVYFSAGQNNARAPFTYFLQGNLNLGFYSFNMPLSYSFSNQGSQLNYSIPFKINRLSLHPKYKWIQAHIGDVSMTFSPYTLAGHEFTGAGIALSPRGSIKLSAMAGRFLKATEYDGNEQTIPAYKRHGYGFKTSFEKSNYHLGIIGFYAKDQLNSISYIPEDKKILPQENLVISMEGSVSMDNGLKINAEYASTTITKDIRAEKVSGNKGMVGFLLKNKASTEHYNAIKAGIDYSLGSAAIGVTYERIDPGYQTLGAYFFNNDFENITLNASTNLFKKINISFNIGYQRDDLNNQKEMHTNRMVGSVNVLANPSEKLSVSGSYSNFRTYTNTKLNQFELINDENLLDNQLDTLQYRQLSQNASLNVNYVISKKKSLQQNININYSLADVANEQGGIVRIGAASTFHNLNIAYSIGVPKQQLQISAALNATLNTIGREDSTTWGPTLTMSKKLFNNKLNTSLSASYNKNKQKENTTSVTNFRVLLSYVFRDKHNFNFSAVQLFRTFTNQKNKELTATFGYSYNF